MSYASFGGLNLVQVDLLIPLVGLWTADVLLESAQPLPNTGKLVFGNMTLQGAVYRQATRWGQTGGRLVGGFVGGWNTVVPPRGYSASFGVLISTVLRDVASEVGERVTVIADGQIGNFWARPGAPNPAPAGATLRAAAGASWWVDDTGTVQVGPRAPGAILSDFQVTSWDQPSGVLELATEDPNSWRPVKTFQSPIVTSPQNIAAARHIIGHDGKSRVRVMVY